MMIPLLAGLILLQDAPEVRVGKRTIPVRLRANHAERGPATMDFGDVKRGEGIMVCFPRDRYAHFYYWTRGQTSKRKYDVAWITSKGKVVDVVSLAAEYMPHKDPPWGINKIRGITSKEEVQYALFMAPNNARRYGIRKKAEVEIELAGTEIEPMPCLECEDEKVKFHLEFVAFEPDRSRGLTYRPNLSEGDGMLFAWPDAKKRPIWMYHTFMSIDVVYIDKDGTILEIHSMRKMSNPNDEAQARRTLVPTKVETIYILEVPYGAMRRAGLKVGSKFKLPEAVTSVTPEESPFE
jgi:uncharacterized membrane protein (UPF0127 family)